MYDGEQLEIMVLSLPHEDPKRTLEAIIEMVVLATKATMRRVGATTLKRSDLFKGIEPDSAFYFRNAKLMRGKHELSLPLDPPPDLVLEVAIGRDALDKFPIYAALGVPEVWRWDGQSAIIYRRDGGTYKESSASAELPPVTSEALTLFVERESEMDNLEWAEMIQAWVRDRHPA